MLKVKLSTDIYYLTLIYEEFEDTKGVMRIHITTVHLACHDGVGFKFTPFKHILNIAILGVFLTPDGNTRSGADPG
jgi:hypothetical protein